ncbi:hypothetical protein [Hahella chejuensis]|nr:hypothetical protein [Hahella chejuensis]
MAFEATETVSTSIESLPNPVEGNQYHKDIVNAWKLVHDDQYSKAFAIADEMTSKIEESFNKKVKQYAFKTEAEFEEFIASDKKTVQRIDWYYTEALRIKAYIYSSNRYFEMALAELNKIDSIAPISAGAKIEKGYIFRSIE